MEPAGIEPATSCLQSVPPLARGGPEAAANHGERPINGAAAGLSISRDGGRYWHPRAQQCQYVLGIHISFAGPFACPHEAHGVVIE
jgi:hypothetical protein